MTVALVHGNPESAAVWDPLVDRLIGSGQPEPLRLSPPGFGAPVPPGWGATVEDYRAWLAGELEGIGDPVDLVGHDWGGAHVLNVAMTRPDLLRSWCSDAVGVFDPDYVWHELAQVWQRAGEGEEAIRALTAAPADVRAGILADRGMALPVARRVAEAIDEVMGDCILRLYRSAAQPVMAELGASLEVAAARPGLAILPADDHAVGTEAQRLRTAARTGARAEVMAGVGHWWFTQDPGRAASVLIAFWEQQ